MKKVQYHVQRQAIIQIDIFQLMPEYLGVITCLNYVIVKIFLVVLHAGINN